jgi:hypothetical protein
LRLSQRDLAITLRAGELGALKWAKVELRSHFSIAPDKNLPFFSKPDERWGCAEIPVKLRDIARTK